MNKDIGTIKATSIKASSGAAKPKALALDLKSALANLIFKGVPSAATKSLVVFTIINLIK